ncbi:MAG: immunoglobulin domain-containing protein [Candidatus Kapabacteria bacterium]|nr:immunoglobulin domain-containing protein [Ignavibacteriota bacterium]MCW5883356.1 immunoglobulin domain-containing protein [Candidatus Kapabacteria bacterium]
MGRLYYLLILLLLLISTSANSFDLTYPKDEQFFCSNTPVIIKWSEFINKPVIFVKSTDDTTYNNIKNYQIADNTFLWYVNDLELFNKELTFKIFDYDYPDDFRLSKSITVYQSPEIISQSKSIQSCEGQDILLDIEAEGYQINFQWFKDGEIINGATSNNLKIPNAEYRNSGVYTCEISSASNCSKKVSEPISVYIASETKFLTRPEFFKWEYRQSASLIAEIHANNEIDRNNVSFQWYKDSTISIFDTIYYVFRYYDIRIPLMDNKKYSGTHSQDLVINNLVWGDRGYYTCIASGLCGVDSVKGFIGDHNYFDVEKESPDFFDCEGIDVTFKASLLTSIDGDFSFQWFKTGHKLLVDDEKFSGTRTLELSIKNPDKDDASGYYVLVTYLKESLTKRSDVFLYDPEYKPIISNQQKYWIIKAPRDYYINQIFLRVSLYNQNPAYFEWFKGEKFLGGGMADDYRVNKPTKDDVGWYKCKITNECGSVWSDSVYVAWGFDEARQGACINSQLTVEADNLGDGYEYEWVFKKNVVRDNHKIINSSTNKLTFTRLEQSDGGSYYLYAVNKQTGNKILLGEVIVEPHLPPEVARDLPETLEAIEGRMPITAFVVLSKGEGVHHTLFIDGEEFYEEIFRPRDSYGNTDFGFVLGGNKSNLKPGVYQYRIRNECGVTWSNKMTVINESYKPGGIILPEDDLTSSIFDNENSFNIYPNPASDYIIINFCNKGIKPFEAADKLQIFDFLGLEVVHLSLIEGKNRINISHLQAGVYFIRMGDMVKKIVKM